MIHTDGIQTIANAPVRRPPLSVPPLPPEGREASALLSRTADGTTVMLHYVAGETFVSVEDADGFRCIPVSADKALDTYKHPYLYLPR